MKIRKDGNRLFVSNVPNILEVLKEMLENQEFKVYTSTVDVNEITAMRKCPKGRLHCFIKKHKNSTSIKIHQDISYHGLHRTPLISKRAERAIKNIQIGLEVLFDKELKIEQS